MSTNLNAIPTSNGEKIIPKPDGLISLGALRAMIAERSVMSAFSAFHAQLGDVFRLQLPGFHPVVLVGPEANEWVLVKEQPHLQWRSENDPIARLLRHGLLVEDGSIHDESRAVMNPALYKPALPAYVEAMVRGTDAIVRQWRDGQTVDLLDEMRKIALLIVYDTLFMNDISPEMDRLWASMLRLLRYISPGLWMIWANAPQRGYLEACRLVNENLYAVLRQRRATVTEADTDLVALLIRAGYDDELIRDQMMTMVVAGHDTTTALLAWAWVMLGQHPDVMARARAEVDAVLGGAAPTMEGLRQLTYLDQVIKETLRLYPPAHLGSRIARQDLSFDGYAIPAGSRVIYSIFLTHRLPRLWDEPERFNPDRFANGWHPPKFTYLPFGGGPRLCIGASFGEHMAAIVLARTLQQADLTIDRGTAHLHMGATIEPRIHGHGVPALVRRST
ncbi:MAG TPA: cytochrome P450 [Candidatus Limnocylindrales bacterium]|nr:cytochrome P450 [Candidatus Limnocylindrales bacterium]